MKRLFKFLILIFITGSSSAQQQKIIAMSVAATSPAADTTEFGVPIIDSTTLFSAIMNVILSDTDSIFQVHVKLGSSLHGV